MANGSPLKKRVRGYPGSCYLDRIFHTQYLFQTATVTVSACYVRGSTGVYITASSNTVINGSVLVGIGSTRWVQLYIILGGQWGGGAHYPKK